MSLSSLWRTKNSAEVWRRKIGAIRCCNNLKQLCVKLNFRRNYQVAFLEQAFLRLALVAFLFFFGLFNFFHQITVAVTMHPGFAAVFAQITGNVLLVHTKTCVNEKPAKISRNYRQKQKKGNRTPKHHCRKGIFRNLNIQVIRINIFRRMLIR
jgi:hypothetical protein